jgi:peptidyl-prolyl cis-trans isomerase SurA
MKSMGYSRDREESMLEQLRKDILDRLIDQKLTDQEIKRAKLEIREEEIDDALATIKEKNYYSNEDFKAALSKEGLTVQEYRESIKEQMLRSRLVNREVKAKVVITEEDIKKYYETHPEAYGREKRYHLRNIIMKLPRLATDNEKKEVLRRMEDVQEKLKEGQSFEKLARMYSESELAAEGGDLGFFKLESLSPQLREALKEMPTGGFTPILETDLGYQIFYIQALEVTPGKSLKEVTPEIQEKLYAEVIDKKFKLWLEDLRKRSHIKIIE